MARQSRRKDQLIHAKASRIALILGVVVSTMHQLKKIPTFPQPNGDAEYCIRDCVEWWLINKSDKARKTAMHAALADRLGFMSPDSPKASTGHSVASDRGLDDQMKLLDLRTKVAKFEREYGDCVRVKHVAPVLEAMSKSIREILESVNRTTGVPMGDGVERAISAAIDKLNQMVGSQDDNAG